MKLRTASGITLTILLVGILTLAFEIQQAKASETIYIKADGSVDPLTAPISSTDNITYSFSGDIIYDKIVVERDDIIIDGKGFTLEGTEAYETKGIDLDNVGSVTVKNLKIIKFYYGIYIYGWSPRHIIIENYIANNHYGVYIQLQDNNIVAENNITNNDTGIYLYSSDNNNISTNQITNNDLYGIEIQGSDNIVHSNMISGSGSRGVWITLGSNNKFYNNIFMNNPWGHAYVSTYSSNIWDNGYPSGGNFWDDFEEEYPDVEDANSGPNQDQTGSDGIWDHAYLVDAEDVDHYPLVPEFSSFLVVSLFMIAALLVVTTCRRRHHT